MQGTKEVINNIKTILKNNSIDDCKKVIEFIVKDEWHIDNCHDDLYNFCALRSDILITYFLLDYIVCLMYFCTFKCKN